ncbi:hypothetical protein SCLCIDRAFT_40861, partial [Scleroderma citrinum Foug A]
MVIPAMDYIDEVFTNSALKKEVLHPAIRAAIGLGKRTLNHYYSLTDSSELYRIAMVLHPRHKLEYFKLAGWKPPWIATAHKLVNDRYDESYAAYHTSEDSDGQANIDMEDDEPANIFDKLPSLVKSKHTHHDELGIYLAADIENVSDPLQWWYEHQHVYPCL